MRISTDDGRFGFLASPLNGRGMFRFQLIIDGRLIGDTEPCILGSAMSRLGDLRFLDDERLGRLADDPAEVFETLRSDELLHDIATLSLAESLDGWLIHGYLSANNVILLAREYQAGALHGPVLVSIVDAIEYGSIFDATRSYWQKASDKGSPII
jgi:hypothetical protein